MNKTLIAILATVAVVAVAAGAYFTLGNSSEDTVGTTSQDSENNSTDVNQFSGTFAELLALGQNYTCTFDTTDDTGNQTSGVVYVAGAGNKMNGEFLVTEPDGNTMDGNIVRDGEYNYVWTSLQSDGIKTKITDEDTSIFAVNEGESETGISDDDNVDFDCQKWNVDNSKFTPPSDINFVEFSLPSVMEGSGETDQEVNLDCSLCDQVPEGEARNQCLSTLGC